MRPLRVGDRVQATGTVTRTGMYVPIEPGIKVVFVKWDDDDYYLGGTSIDIAALTLIEPAEPPVGSVVVKDGVAWVRSGHWWYAPTGDHDEAAWSNLSDGDVIFTPGGDS